MQIKVNKCKYNQTMNWKYAICGSKVDKLNCLVWNVAKNANTIRNWIENVWFVAQKLNY
jgi:hypothetical protein